jgi:hypothetical protein
MQVDGAAMQVDGAAMQVDGAAMRVDGAAMRIDDAAMQVDDAAMRIDDAAMRISGTKPGEALGRPLAGARVHKEEGPGADRVPRQAHRLPETGLPGFRGSPCFG